MIINENQTVILLFGLDFHEATFTCILNGLQSCA